MNEKKIIEEILVAVDEFLIYRTDGKLQELSRARNKLRKIRNPREVWLYENEEALSLVRQGLIEAKELVTKQ